MSERESERVNEWTRNKQKQMRKRGGMEVLAHLIYLMIFKLKWINDQLSLLGRIMALPSQVDLYVVHIVLLHIIQNRKNNVCVCLGPYSLPFSLSHDRSFYSFFSFIVFEFHNFVALSDFETWQMNFINAHTHIKCTHIA